MRMLLKESRMFGMYALAIAMLLALSPRAFADFHTSQAKVLKIEGTAQVLKAEASEWSALSPDMILSEGDKLKTGEKTELILELTGGAKTAEVTIRENTVMTFGKFRHEVERANDQTLLDVTAGGILIRAEKLRGDSKFEVKTPTSIAGIRGTIFEVQVS